MSPTLSILTPERRAFNDEITEVVAPGVEGSFAMLTGHAPLIAALETGIVKVRSATDDLQYFVLDRGLLEVRNDDIAILADHVESATDAADAESKVKGMHADSADA